MRGDHICVRRIGYTHHGIDAGDGTVIHYSGSPSASKTAATVCRDATPTFAAGGKIETRRYRRPAFSPDQIVERAEKRIGERGFNLAFNNCEHFATWCVTDNHSSRQTNGASAGAGVTATAAAAGAAGIGVVSATGEVAGLSGAGIMSGLATTGGLIGGGAIAGLYVLSAAPRSPLPRL